MLCHDAMAVVCESILELVGKTPLVRIRNLGREASTSLRSREGSERAEVWAKMEQQNPAGSVKDRIALAMIDAAEKDGRLKPGGVVIEPTSGNTGIAIAMVCAVRGYRCILTLPASMSLERRALLAAYGAEVVLTPEDEQMEGAVRKAEEIASVTPNAFVPHQFDNPENPAIHERTTAKELLEQMGADAIDAFVAGVGTGGTVSGVGKILQNTRIIAVEPEACATISRGERGPTKLQGLGAGFVPKTYDASVVDEVRTVSDVAAWRVKDELAKREGLLVGISAGAAMAVALDVARELGSGKNVVTVLPDTGERYFSLGTFFTR